MKVLVTRPEPDATVFAERCRVAGLTPIIAPLMHISIEKKPIDISEMGALAFTSTSGVRAFCASHEARDLAVFAVGGATGDEALAAGFKDVSIADGDIGSLTSLIDEQRRRITGAILQVAGAHRAGDLVNALKLLGVEARREVLYAAKAVDKLPENARAAIVANTPVEWAAFFSPRTAALFLVLVKNSGIEDRLRFLRAVCLSEAVADVFANTAWKSIEIAPRRDTDAVINAITENAPHDRA